MDCEDGGDRVDVVARDAECAAQPGRGHRAGADPLGGSDPLGRVVVGALGDRHHQRAHQQMVLHEKLAAHADERGARQPLEGEVGIERRRGSRPSRRRRRRAGRTEAPRDATSPTLRVIAALLDRLGVGDR